MQFDKIYKECSPELQTYLESAGLNKQFPVKAAASWQGHETSQGAEAMNAADR